MSTENANIQLVHCDSYLELTAQMAQEAMSSGTQMVPGTLYKQGGRYCLQTALSLDSLRSLASANRPANKSKLSIDIEAVQAATNRPLDSAHAKSIGDYIVAAHAHDSPYILPGLTLNMDQSVRVFTLEGNAPTRAAVMLMPIGARMEITDGQHRVEGVSRAIELAKEVGQDAIGAMVTFTADMSQVHQDFADCAKTKNIAPSMLAVYDLRNPANGLAVDLAKQSPLFRYTVDAAKASISPRSVMVWTTNQLRVMLKWALIGQQSADDVFSANANTMLGERGSPEYQAFLSGMLRTIEIFVQHNPLLHQIAQITPATLDEVPKLREAHGSLLMSGTGLAVLGYLWHQVRAAKRERNDLDTEEVIRRLANVNWSESTNGRINPLFAANIKINPERRQSGAKYVKAAGDEILYAAGGLGG